MRPSLQTGGGAGGRREEHGFSWWPRFGSRPDSRARGGESQEDARSSEKRVRGIGGFKRSPPKTGGREAPVHRQQPQLTPIDRGRLPMGRPLFFCTVCFVVM